MRTTSIILLVTIYKYLASAGGLALRNLKAQTNLESRTVSAAESAREDTNLPVKVHIQCLALFAPAPPVINKLIN